MAQDTVFHAAARQIIKTEGSAAKALEKLASVQADDSTRTDFSFWRAVTELLRRAECSEKEIDE